MNIKQKYKVSNEQKQKYRKSMADEQKNIYIKIIKKNTEKI